MKFRVLLISLTLLMGRYAICQCGEPTFTKDDKVRDVKQKLTCFANENATLKQKVAELQANLTSLNNHLDFSGEAYNPGVYPMSQCKSNAIEAVANEGGRLIGNGNDWTVGFEINGMKVAVILPISESRWIRFYCRSDERFGRRVECGRPCSKVG